MSEDDSLLSKLDSVVPNEITQFDAFPKLPSTYKSRSEGRGFLTLFVGFLAFLLMLNDIGEYIWGWPDYEFSVDKDRHSFMSVNVDLVVNMPCRYLSVDLRDALGDRLMLTGSGLRRDGTRFDIGQATKLKEHAAMLSATQAIRQSRKSRGFFSTILRPFTSSSPQFKPTEPKYEHTRHGSACRIYGAVDVKKVTANLHVTTLGHGYASHEHVDHKFMNLSHVISEFSFGPYFPDITQPLDYSFEVAKDPFVAYQYFLHVVPTAYIAPRSKPLNTAQYSVTHYTRVLEHGRGTPGIFFKFDLDPMALTVHQRTTSFLQLIIRCVGVIGGVFVCSSYAIRVTTKAVEVVAGQDDSQGIVAASASGAKPGLRAKWGGNDLRSRVNRQSSGWEGSQPGTPASGYATFSPMAQQFSGSAAPSPYLSPSFNNSAGSPYGLPHTPQSNAQVFPPTPSFNSGFSVPPTPNLNSSFGPAPGSAVNSPSLNGSFGGSSSRPSSMYGPPPSRGHRTTSGGSMSVSSLSAVVNGSPSPANSPSLGSGASLPSVPSQPGTPNPMNGMGPPPRRAPSGGKKDD